MHHSHVSSHEKHWLPANNGLLTSHPPCRECCIVKAISLDRAKGRGYYINTLVELKNCRGEKLLSNVQIRLIVNELQKIEDFEDNYYMTFTNQKWIFIDAVRKYSDLSPSFIEAFLN